MPKNGERGAILAILIPIVLVVTIASLVFAVFDGIVEIIEGVATAVVDYLKDPIGSRIERQAANENFWGDLFGIGNFNVEEYRKYKVDTKIFISLEQFNKMVDELDTSINTDVAGLDDLTLKKMLLTYYKNTNLKDTELYIQLTEEEYNNKDVDKIFKKVKEKQTDDSEKLPYLKTNGSVTIKAKDTDSVYKKMLCFSEQGLREIYANEYIPNLKEDGSENSYATSVREILSKCYTAQGNNIKMIAFNIEEIENIYEYKDAGIKIKKTQTKLKNGNGTEPEWVTIDYVTDISGYAMSLEFLTSLMQISQSRDFVNEVMNIVEDNSEIQINLYNTKLSNEEKIVKEYTQDVIVSANGIDKTHRDSVKHTQIKRTIEYKYETGITKAKVWHSETTYENKLSTEEKKYYIREDGEKMYTVDENNDFKIKKEDEPEVIFYKSENPEIFNLDNEEKTDLNEIFKYTIKKKSDGYNYKDYNFNQMYILNTNIKESTLHTVEEVTLVNGISTVKDKTDVFLDLLIKNNVKQKYESLYGGESQVGELLVNGEGMLYELLESSPNSQGMADIMRYIINRYKTGAQASDEQFANIYNLQAISGTVTIIGDSAEEKIWCTLRSLGYSEYAVAGVMGNVSIDSDFKENGDGILKWSDTRKIGLETYAKTKNVKKDDINTQIEYLIGEITEGGGCNRICKISIRNC